MVSDFYYIVQSLNLTNRYCLLIKKGVVKLTYLEKIYCLFVTASPAFIISSETKFVTEVSYISV